MKITELPPEVLKVYVALKIGRLEAYLKNTQDVPLPKKMRRIE